MKREWIRKLKGSRLANAADAASCKKNDSPLCFAHSVPRLVSRCQMGRLSRTKICCNAWISARSINDRAVRTRARSPGALNGVDHALSALQDGRGCFGLFRRLDRCLPDFLQLIQASELLFQIC